MGGLEFKNWGEMSVTDTIFGRWKLAVADDAYIRNRSGTNIGVQTYNTILVEDQLSPFFFLFMSDYFYVVQYIPSSTS
jgi:hypothetical protein